MPNYPNYMNYAQPMGYAAPQQMNYQPQQPQGTGIEVVYATESEAINYLVPIGKKMLFIITDKPKCIFKATDGLGYSTSDHYKMEKLPNNPTEEQKQENFVKPDDLKGFVTAESFNSKIAEISQQIEDIKKIKMQTFNKENK